jgi:hypothetical protein
MADHRGPPPARTEAMVAATLQAVQTPSVIVDAVFAPCRPMS